MTDNKQDAAVTPPSPSSPSPASGHNLDQPTNAEEEAAAEALLRNVESLKDKGNIEFHKGRALAKHTAGKNILSDVCLCYAEGIQALAKVDAHLTQLRKRDSSRSTTDAVRQSGNSSSGNSSSHATCCPEENAGGTAAEMSSRADTLRSALYLNLAAVNLLMEEWTPALACCTHVIEGLCQDVIARAKTAERATPVPVGPGSRSDGHGEQELPCVGQLHDVAAKALYRRSMARVGKGGDVGVLAARGDLRLALTLKPGDVNVRRELKKVEKMVADARARDNLRRETEEGRRRIQQRNSTRNGAVNSASESSSSDKCEDETARTATAPRPSSGADGAADAHDSAINMKNNAIERETESENNESTDLAPLSPPPRPPTNTACHHHHPQLGVHSANSNQGVRSVATGASDRYETAAGVDERPGQVEDNGEEPDAKEAPSERRAERTEKPSEPGASSTEEEEPFPTGNGRECRDGVYAWNQSVHEVQVCVRVPNWARARDVRVEIGRSRLSVSVVQLSALRSTAVGSAVTTTTSATAVAAAAGTPNSLSDNDSSKDNAASTTCIEKQQGKNRQQTTSCFSSADNGAGVSVVVVLEGPLSRPVEAGECLWTMETPSRVLLYLQKELPAEGEPGFEWWACVMKGDLEVDVVKCDAGSIASKYPEHARRRGAKALWEHQRKSPEQRRMDEVTETRMREARRQMEEEAEERQRDLDKALRDPKKAEMYRRLKEIMPDTTISLT